MLLCLFSGVIFAEEKGIEGPLAKLPSKEGPHISKIKEMMDHSWLDLGSPKADPKWGKGRGRSWSCSMPYAPELRGAFLYGQGKHGYVKPDGHYMDDLWFYDFAAHRWICLYPGADVKNLDMKVNEEGFEATKNGEIIPVATMVHAYEMVTYDTDKRQFLSMLCPGGFWRKALGKRRERWLGPASER